MKAMTKYKCDWMKTQQAFWRGETPHVDNGQYGFQTVLQDPEYGPAGIVYDATSARGNPALVGFLTASKAGPGEDYNVSDVMDVMALCLMWITIITIALMTHYSAHCQRSAQSAIFVLQ